jgi:hypothetical protein
VIDLNELKKSYEESEMFYPNYNDVITAIDRALAAESERDELKAKIADAESFLSFEQSENERLKSKLAGRDKARAHVEWVCEHANHRWPDGGGRRFQSEQEANEFIASERNFSGHDTVSRVYTKQPKPVEPVQASEPLGFTAEDKQWLTGFFKREINSSEIDSNTYYGGDTTPEARQRNAKRQQQNRNDVVMFTRMLSAVESPVTPNKAEVPLDQVMVPKQLLRDYRELIEGKKLHVLEELVLVYGIDALLDEPLPPLKDDEK